MIQVTIGTNVQRQSFPMPPDTTIRAAIEETGIIDYALNPVHLDGSTLSPGDMDKTFADFGITEKCFLLSVVKTSGA